MQIGFANAVYASRELTDPALRENKLYSEGTPPAHLDYVQSLAFSPDGTRIASGGFRNVKIWQLQAPSRLGDFPDLVQPATVVAGSTAI